MQITRNGKFGILAVVAVALVAAGAAFAATQFHGSSANANGRGPGGFAGPMLRGGNGYFGPGGQGFVPGGDDRRGGGFGFRGSGGDISAAAAYLGLSQSALFQQLQSGKTLAHIANATSGKSASGLIDALVAAQEKEIAAAVKSGILSQATADQITANLKARITDRVNGAFGPGRGGFGPDGDHGGFGPPSGRTPQTPQSSTPPTHI
jgi:hypothetical protein